MVDVLLNLLAYVGPFVVGLVTVPLFDLVKKGSAWVNGLPVWGKQVAVVLVASALTFLGQFLLVALPVDLALFTEGDVSALLAAIIAFAVKAGKKASQVAEASQPQA
jgi:hypothetical protein